MSLPERFASLLGPDFKVSVTLTLPAMLSKQAKNIFDESKPLGLTHEKNGKKQVFIPPYAASEVDPESLRGNKTVKILFSSGATWPWSEECFLVFRRKVDFQTRQSRIWLMVAREGEESYFNAFSSLQANPVNQEYVTLLFASKIKHGFSGFTPLYIKAEIGEELRYFKISANGKGVGDVLVEIGPVSEEEAPESLRVSLPLR